MAALEQTPGAGKPRRAGFQIGLRMLCWITAAFAVWISIPISRSENERLASKIERLRPLAHDLIVDDPKQFAAVQLDNLWMDEQRWDVSLPPGKYRVCLATREVEEKDDGGFPEAFWTAPIEAGRHRLFLEQDSEKSGTRIRLTVDGSKLMALTETKDWSGNGWTSRGGFPKSGQRPVAKPLVLLRRQLSYSDSSGRSVREFGPVNGLLLWVERIGEPDRPGSP